MSYYKKTFKFLVVAIATGSMLVACTKEEDKGSKKAAAEANARAENANQKLLTAESEMAALKTKIEELEAKQSEIEDLAANTAYEIEKLEILKAKQEEELVELSALKEQLTATQEAIEAQKAEVSASVELNNARLAEIESTSEQTKDMLAEIESIKLENQKMLIDIAAKEKLVAEMQAQAEEKFAKQQQQLKDAMSAASETFYYGPARDLFEALNKDPDVAIPFILQFSATSTLLNVDAHKAVMAEVRQRIAKMNTNAQYARAKQVRTEGLRSDIANDTYLVQATPRDVRDLFVWINNDKKQISVKWKDAKGAAKSGTVGITKFSLVPKVINSVRVHPVVYVMNTEKVMVDAVNLKPFTVSVSSSQALNLDNPVSVFGEKNAQACLTVSIDCFQQLSNDGLLDHKFVRVASQLPASFVAKMANKTASSYELTAADLLSHYVERTSSYYNSFFDNSGESTNGGGQIVTFDTSSLSKKSNSGLSKLLGKDANTSDVIARLGLGVQIEGYNAAYEGTSFGAAIKIPVLSDNDTVTLVLGDLPTSLVDKKDYFNLLKESLK